MGHLQPISKTDGKGVGFAITADKMKRICLNAGFMRELNHTEKTELYLYWDAEYRRIGLSRECHDKNIVPFSFDTRGYTQAKDFLQRCGIDTNEKAVSFYYEGVEKGIYVFIQAGRVASHFKQQKNGDLVSIN